MFALEEYLAKISFIASSCGVTTVVRGICRGESSGQSCSYGLETVAGLGTNWAGAGSTLCFTPDQTRNKQTNKSQVGNTKLFVAADNNGFAGRLSICSKYIFSQFFSLSTTGFSIVSIFSCLLVGLMVWKRLIEFIFPCK